jgi:HK97 family phage portal protein
VAWRDLFRWGRKAANAYDILREISARYRSRTGRNINVETATRVSTIFGGCRLVGHGMATPPFKLMQEANGKRLPAADHPLYDLLARKPNPWQTSFEFRETLSWHLELCFNAYVFINRSSILKAGEILELIPIDPNCVKVNQADDYTITYDVRSQNGSLKTFPAEAIWHIRGPSWDSVRGIEFLAAAREAIGLAMALEESQAALQGNGVQSTGAWVVDGKLQPGQYQELRDWIVREHVGPDKAGKPFILDRAAKWVSNQMTNVDAQTREMRQQQVEEICRFMVIFPIMLGYSDKATTYASSEQMFLAHSVHTLSPRWTRFEQSADAYLLTDQERADGFYFDFIEEGMIRGSVKETTDTIIARVNGGLMTPNEGRAKLDLNPDADPASDKLRIPVNTVQDPKKPAGDGGNTGAPP